MSSGSPSTQSAADPLRVIRAMTEVASRAALREVAVRLHAKLNAPANARERRVAELGFLAKLLAEFPQHPGRLPYVERGLYDERRPSDAPDAPQSARLAEHYTSWRRACYAAWTLLDDGRWTEGGLPWPASLPGKVQPPPYTRDEAIASLKLCAEAVGRVPSSSAYLRWRQNRINLGRSRGAEVRLVSQRRVSELLAPEAMPRERWRNACDLVFRPETEPAPD
jgi:hypothetical protein